MNINENNIVSFLAKGEEKAYKYLFDNHYAILCHIAASIVHDDSIAEDIVSDVFLNIYERRATLEIHTSLKNYLFASVRNRSLNVLAGMKKYDTIHLDLSLQDNQDNPDSTITVSEIQQILDESIFALSPECRQVFEKSRIEGKTYNEIAEELGISVNTVKYHIKNALAHIRKNLGTYASAIVLFFTTLFGWFVVLI